MENTKSKKRKTLTTAIAIILAIAMVFGGSTYAYLQANTDDVVNDFKTNQVNVDLKETTGNEYNIIPGTSQAKDPTVTVTTTIPAYVYIEVTDTTDNLIEYSIAESWLQLDGYDNVYYRETDSDVSFPVLENNSVSYSENLTNSDMVIQNADGTYSLKDGITLSFNASAIQKDPFKDAVEAYQVLTNTVPVLNGYTTLYEYDLSATEKDDVKAYYVVPNKNTSPIEVKQSTNADMNLFSSLSNVFMPITANAAENDVVEYNGIKYELSDEDVLVISGNGEMKENIQADLIDYEGIRNAVYNKFHAKPTTDYSAVTDNDTIYAYYYLNQVYPGYITQKIDGIKYSSDTTYGYRSEELLNTYIEICNYIDEILTDYAVSMPSKVIINDGITNISKKAFYRCFSLESVEIANTVETIENSAFYGCIKLTDITIPESVKTIEANAFASCQSLTTITIPNSVTTIDTRTFYNCSKLKDVTIPNSVTSIEYGAFENCTSLTTFTIPNSVTRIGKPGYSVFTDCCNLSSLYIPASVTEIYEGFNRLANNTTVYCENQAVADLLKGNYNTERVTVVVAPEMFS